MNRVLLEKVQKRGNSITKTWKRVRRSMMELQEVLRAYLEEKFDVSVTLDEEDDDVDLSFYIVEEGGRFLRLHFTTTMDREFGPCIAEISVSDDKEVYAKFGDSQVYELGGEERFTDLAVEEVDFFYIHSVVRKHLTSEQSSE